MNRGEKMNASKKEKKNSLQDPLIQCESLTKIYQGIDSSVNLVVLKTINFTIPRFTFTGILGPSGSGKTTLLNVISAIDPFQGGKLVVDGILINELKEIKKSAFWRNKISFIYQFPEDNVFMNLTVAENFILSGSIYTKEANFKDKVQESLKNVNLNQPGIKKRKVKTLSGGELQRLAIAQALVRKTPILLADEPTGELDTKNSEKIFKLMREITRKKIATTIVVSHDKTMCDYCDQVYLLEDGMLTQMKTQN